MRTGAHSLWHPPKLCFCAKVLLLAPPTLPQNHSSQPMTIHLFKTRRLLFQPLLLLTNPPLLPLLPTHPIDPLVLPLLLLLQATHQSGLHLVCETVVILTTTGTMASTPQGVPSFQEPCRGLRCQLGAATGCLLQGFPSAHHTKQCPQCSSPLVFILR
jgi:hypothetical protein